MSADDPIRRVQQLSRPELPRRFYREAAAEPGEGGFAILLDGKPVRTPGKRPLVLPNATLAEAVVAEWQAQAEAIDPATMPVTRIVNVAIDGVADRTAEVRAEIVAYAGSDLICYRADRPEGLIERQDAAWQPLVEWAAANLGARLQLAIGVIHLTQEAEALAAVDQALAPFDGLSLAALHTLTTLTGSAVIALAVARGRLNAEAAWQAAHVDEDWQIDQWGTDAEAMANRARRRREFDAAVTVIAATAGEAGP